MITSKTNKSMSKTETPVTFRLSDADNARLTEEAEQRGLGRNAYARELVMEGLRKAGSHFDHLINELQIQIAKNHEAAAETSSRFEELLGEALAAVESLKTRSNSIADPDTNSKALLVLCNRPNPGRQKSRSR
jgi:hypothetical protein